VSAKGATHLKMKCPGCGKAVAYSDDAVNERWLRRHGPKTARCPKRAIGNVVLYYEFWKKKGLLDL
jgi:hypothetical protein